ncbi:MAG: HAMP domain-containing sensor histidine kinase [Pseudomonadota bacterium]|nr:HAMP domain-containing sensor histidine kinase [Pseudomonadota bacterium]
MNKIYSLIGSSLSARLLLIFLFATIAYAIAARYAYSLFTDVDYLRRIAGSHIVLHSDYVIKDLGSPPDISKAEKMTKDLPLDIFISGPGLEWKSTPDFYDLEQVSFSSSPSIQELYDLGQTELEPWVERLADVEFSRFLDHAIVRLTSGDYQIVFVSPRISEMPDPDYSSWIAALVGSLILLACYLAVRWLFQPITWMKEGASRIGGGELEYRIPTKRNDELTQLTRDINSMAEDVEDMLDAKQQLLLSISHELRSPITRSKVAAEFIQEEKTRKNILQDLDEMESLITDLLESEALNTRHAILHRESVDLGGLITSVIDSDFLNKKSCISIEIEAGLPEIQLDVARLKLLIRNLVGNALRYNLENSGFVKISVNKKTNDLVIVIQDQGPGIPSDQLSFVTEPFYRADPARSRATGGFGLGLYLCKKVVEAHGGDFKIESKVGLGTSVIVSFPLKRND